MKWKTLESETIFKSGVVTLDKQKCLMPDGRTMPGYYILRFPDWVNIIPIRRNGDVVLIRQYRHATGEIHWEVPGGAVNRGEDPQVAAIRELGEETGYVGERVVKVAENYPNPALQDNRVHTYIAFDCDRKTAQSLDPFEEIEVQTLTMAELEEWLAEGRFNHNVMVASLYQALAYLKKEKGLEGL